VAPDSKRFEQGGKELMIFQALLSKIETAQAEQRHKFLGDTHDQADHNDK
jgi:hypothetical protein